MAIPSGYSLLMQTTGNSVGPGSKFYTVAQIYGKDTGSGYHLYLRRYIHVDAGTNGFQGTIVSTSWGNVTLYHTGDYGIHDLNWTTIPYGGSVTMQASDCRAGYNSYWSQPSSNMTYTAPKPTYTIKYDANGGTGAPANQTKTYGTNITLSTDVPTRDGYFFQGWATTVDGIVSYNAGDTYLTNAALSLYAVWLVADLIDFSVITQFISIPYNSNSYGGLPVQINLEYSPITTDNNASVNFYYTICSVDDIDGNVANYIYNNDNLIYGAFTSTTCENDTIKISPSMILRSLKATKAEDELLFLLKICTGGNSFSEETTINKIIRLPLVGFNAIDATLILSRRASDGSGEFVIDVDYPNSYDFGNNTIPPIPSVKINNSSESSPSDSGFVGGGVVYDESTNIVRYTYIASSDYLPSDSSHKIEFIFTDNIYTSKLSFRIGAVGGEDILVFSNGKIQAVEFIEGSDFNIGVGGRVYINELIEV